MGCINLKEYFMQYAYKKLEMELSCYKQQMYQLSAKEVFDHAYEIDSYINIYEILLIKIEYLTSVQIWGMLMLPHILSFFYMRWLDVEDSHAQELDEIISEIIEKEWDISSKSESQR